MSMRDMSQARVARWGVTTLVVMALLMAAAFNLSQFPGLAGNTYTAEFSEASGISEGNVVQVGGIRSGRVEGVELAGSKVVVTFELDPEITLGKQSTAAIEVKSLLGEKYLNVVPAGEEDLDPGGRIPRERTRAAYDIVDVFGDLTATTEQIDKGALKRAFDVLADTADSAAPEIQSSFEGIARLSKSVSSRDAELQRLLKSSKRVSKVLADRGQDLVRLMDRADLVFKELRRRKDAIHRLLVNARVLARELRGVAEDNQKQLAPALRQLDDLLDTLIRKEKGLKATLDAVGPYSSILSNIIGTGPWFDAYAVNLLGFFTGEFKPVAPDVAVGEGG